MLCLVDIGVHPFGKGLDDRGAARVIPVQFLLHVTAILEQAVSHVPLQFLGAENFRHSAGGLAPPEFKLKQPVPRRIKSLGKEEVRFILGIDVGDAPVVLDDLHRLGEAGQGQRFRRRGGAGRKW